MRALMNASAPSTTWWVFASHSPTPRHGHRPRPRLVLGRLVLPWGGACEPVLQRANSLPQPQRNRPAPFQDGRVTDHRVPGLSIMGGVERVLSGDMLDALIDAVAAARREEALAEVLEAQRAAAAGESQV